MTHEEPRELDRQARLAGKRIIEEQARRQVRTFLDELRNGTRNYRTVASLGGQVAQEYRGRAILELLQNAHDVLPFAPEGDPRRISFVLRSSPEPELLVANSGHPFRRADFSGICQLAQSPKDPNESVGNKGLGFQSVLELSACPEVWSTAQAEGDAVFTFGFDPRVRDPIGRVAQALVDGGPATDPEFGSEPVVDWSDKQIDEYRGRLSRNGINPVKEVTKYLSPYVLPRFLGDPPDQVARLLEDGHVTVIRLPLDGGRTGNADDAVESVRGQLETLDEAAMVFLSHLSALRVEVDEEAVELKRQVEPERPLTSSREGHGHEESSVARHTRLRVGRTGPDASDAMERSFRVWSRIVGGADQPETTERIAGAVRHLPNRWPEVRRVEVAVAVEETREAGQGAFVIFLPTTMKTGVGAHVNAPFYGSLDRKKINFDDEYNELLLEFVTDLVLDAVAELVKGPAEPWRARAVIDLLAQASASPPSDDPELMRRFRERACDGDHLSPLEQVALILCDDGWCKPGVARTMPSVPADDPLGEAQWRVQAGFAVASSVLDERREAVENLLRSLGGSPGPREEEWARTLERLAQRVLKRQADASSVQPHAAPGWNTLLSSVLAVLPPELRSEPKAPDADSLAKAGFLPTEDGRLLSASDAVRIFFQPRRGADDAADFVGSVPVSLQERIAFLHHDVKTHEGTQRRRTEVQKFLDGRLVQSFRREDLLREVIIPSLPELPVGHGSLEAIVCADALAWTLEVIGQEEPEGLLPLLARLPVACTGGWFPMREAVFGPGWAGCYGDHLRALAKGLPREEGEELLRSALLPPGDERWLPRGDKRGTTVGETHAIELANRGNQFARAGVLDGLRLEVCKPARYGMSSSNPHLPDQAPASVSQEAWDDWREAVLGQVKPDHWQEFQYELQDVKALPLLHHKALDEPARQALSDLVLASLVRWDDGWEKVTIRLRRGNWHWAQQITSPLSHWLSTVPWLDDGLHGGPQELHERWFVPESLLRGQSGRFRHLSPLPLPLARRLGADGELLTALEEVGLCIYPTEDVRTGPALLETLADVVETLLDGAAVRNEMPAGGFDVLLGQIRHGWRHLDPEGLLPTRFIIRTKPRTLAVRTVDELKDVYLPGRGWRTRLLREHGQPIVAMRPQEASGPVGDRLVKLGARRATGLEEHCLIDHRPSAEAADGTQTLDALGLGWLPVVLLALHAHGGGNPAGPATKAWQEAAARLRRARVRQCRSIEVELRDAGQTVARSEPRAHWLSRDRVLVLYRDIAHHGSYEGMAAAAQAILDRQDLLKDFRLVLGALGGRQQPTRGQIEEALDRAEIDTVAVADVRHRWLGETSTLVHRIRPVLRLLGVAADGLDEAATDTARLTEWLSKSADIPKWPTDKWPAEELLAAARQCYDDIEMGYRTWQVLGDDYDLQEWNAALADLDGKYEQVSSTQAEAQATRYLYEAAPLLRAFARHVATVDDSVPVEDQGRVFAALNKVHGRLEGSAEWSDCCEKWSGEYWKVPFGEVLDVLRAGYEAIPKSRRYLDVIKGVTSINELCSALEQRGVALEPDPREVARGNQYRLDRAIRRVHHLYGAWLAKEGTAPVPSAEPPEARLDDSMYLRDWPEDDLIERAKLAVADRDFRTAVTGCQTMEAMCKRLDITCPDGNGKREPQPTRDVAGVTEPVDGTDDNYRDIFERLKELPEPPKEGGGIGPPSAGPDGNGGAPPIGKGEVGKSGPKTAHLHPSPHLPEFVGIIGEMQAFRFLKAKFGIDESAWVSEFRNRVVPPLAGEKDETSDGHGYDFRFTHGGVTWCVEVKATTGDGTSFDLPSSELNAASRIAPRKNERWRVLRVRRALTERPECDWLPNPFEPGGGERLRLRQGGVTVEYALSEAATDPAARSQAHPAAQSPRTVADQASQSPAPPAAPPRP